MIFGTEFQLLAVLVAGAFWIFVLWMLWRIVQALKGMDDGLKEIAHSLRERPLETRK
jgi:hypothetical protein